jgi:hypothetical protein
MSNFQYILSQLIEVECSGEQGYIVSRCESVHEENKYLVNYQRSDGVGVENWWYESSLIDPSVPRDLDEEELAELEPALEEELK